MENSSLNKQSTGCPKWRLTSIAFDQLLSYLHESDREEAAEKYLLLHHNLVRFFEGRGLAEADSAADEVCNRLARKLETGERFQDINQYAYGIARMLVLEFHRTQTQRQKALTAITRPNSANETEDEEDDKLFFLNQSLNELSPENRELILNYYRGAEGSEKIEIRRRLAEKLGIPPNALQNRAVRLRHKLKNLILKKLQNENFRDRFWPISSVNHRGD